MPIPVMVAIAGRASGLMGALGEAEGGIGKLGGSLGKLSGQFAALSGAGAMGTFVTMGKGALQMAADYETAMIKIDIQTQATAESVELWRVKMKDISSDTGVGIDKVAEAMFMVASSGFAGADALLILDSALKGAKVSGGDLVDTAKVLSAIMNTLDIPAGKAVGVMNALVETTRLGHAEMEDMASGFKNVISIASTVGVSYTEVGAALAVLTNQLMNADSAGTHLSSTLRAMQFTTQKQQKALDSLGLSATDLANKLGKQGLKGTLDEIMTAVDQEYGTNMRGLSQEFLSAGMSAEEFEEKLDSMTGRQGEAVQKLKAIFGTAQALRAVLSLTGKNAEEFAKAIDDINRAAGNTESIDGWADKSKTLNERWGKFVNDLKLFALEVGEQLMPMAEKVISKLETFKKWLNDNETAVSALADVLKFALIGALILVGLSLATLVFWGVILWLVFHTLKAVIESLTEVFTFLGEKAEEVAEILSDFFDFLLGKEKEEPKRGGSFLSGFASILGQLPGVIKTHMDQAKNEASGGMFGLGNIFNTGNSGILGSFSGTWFMISTIVGNAMSAAWGAVSGFMGGIVTTVTGALSAALSAFIAWGSGVISSIVSSLSTALAAASVFVGSFFSVGADLIGGVSQGVMSRAGALASAAASVVRRALQAAKDAIWSKSPSRLAAIMVGVPISQGIAMGITAAAPLIDKSVADAVRGPLSGEYNWDGAFSAGSASFRGRGNLTNQGGNTTTNIYVELSGNVYGDGGIRRIAEDVRVELLRLQRNKPLGFEVAGIHI